MSEYVTDPEILSQLNAGPGTQPVEEPAVSPGEGYIDDPKLLARLNAATQGPVAPEGAGILGAIAPAVTAYGMGPTGMAELGQAVRAGATPYMQTVGEGLKKTADIYKARPIMAPLIDAAGCQQLKLLNHLAR